MKKPTNTLPNHYSSLEDLTLYRWDKYNQTHDNNWFLVDYDGREKKLICDELKQVENVLVDEYFRLIDDRSFTLKIQKWAKIDLLRTKYQNVGNLLDRFSLGFVDMETRYLYVLELKKWGFKFNLINSVEEDLQQVEEFRHVLQGISTQIGILANELKDDGKKQTQSLSKQLQIATLGLNYPYRLDAKILTVVEWIEICKLLDEKAKQN